MKQQINKAGEQSTGMAKLIKNAVIIQLKGIDIERLIKKEDIEVTGLIKKSDLENGTQIMIQFVDSIHVDKATLYGKQRLGAYVKIPRDWADEYSKFAVIPLKIEASASENEKEAIG